MLDHTTLSHIHTSTIIFHNATDKGILTADGCFISTSSTTDLASTSVDGVIVKHKLKCFLVRAQAFLDSPVWAYSRHVPHPPPQKKGISVTAHPSICPSLEEHSSVYCDKSMAPPEDEEEKRRKLVSFCLHTVVFRSLANMVVACSSDFYPTRIWPVRVHPGLGPSPVLYISTYLRPADLPLHTLISTSLFGGTKTSCRPPPAFRL